MRYKFVIFFCLIFHSSCNQKADYFPMKEGKKISYNINFVDKEKKKKTYKQHYIFLKQNNKAFPMLRNDGHVVYYKKVEKGVKRVSTKYLYSEFISIPKNKLDREENNFVLRFPLKIGASWSTNDQTSLMMKVGYDKVFQTFLPFEMKKKIVSVSDTIILEQKKIKNCIKIVGKGKTSYNPGPPLGNINIDVLSTSWYAPEYGLVKLVREEKADSETMGHIIYDKTLVLEN